MRVLITGGCGFVGFWTATRFLEAGHEVVCYDRRIDPDRVAVGAGRRAVYVEGDILDPARLLAAMRPHEVSGVVHAAALISQQVGAADPVRTYRVNVEGTLNVLEAVRTAGARMVYVSTATLYGRHPDLHALRPATSRACYRLTARYRYDRYTLVWPTASVPGRRVGSLVHNSVSLHHSPSRA